MLSERRGFSNSLGLGRKSHRIGLSGYNYDRLYKYAEMVAEKVRANKRVNDGNRVGKF